MMTNLKLFLLFLLVTTLSYSQNIDFSISSIPQELKENANSVVRFENRTITIQSQRSMVIKVEKVITILNKLADNYSDITLQYDKRRVIRDVKMVVFDKEGKEIKKIKKSEFKDYSATGNSLFTDSRMINYDYTAISYPYTVYLKYEIRTSNTAQIAPFFPISGYYQSIEKSYFKVVCPEGINLVKSEHNFEGFNVKKEEELGVLSYELKRNLALEKEPFAPRLSDFLPFSRLAVDKFSVEGLIGYANNYKELGRWEYENFYSEIGELSMSTILKIKDLAKNVDDPMEKAKIVYNYVQDKVRYISVQVGVGGLKPMLASEVNQLSYGDCKALSNYTRALMEVVGVKAYFTELYGGYYKTDMDANIPGIHGNHVILYLPNGDEDVWLECTSQNIPFGYIAGFTDDRDVIVITPEGGIVKHTRVYRDDENKQSMKGRYSLDTQGNIEGEIVMVSSGTQFKKHLCFEGLNEKELDKQYKEFWDNINNMTIDDITINNKKEQGQFEESISFVAENYGVISGDRMIFPVNAFNVINKAPKRIRNRKLPVEVVRGFYDVDEVEIQLPEGYEIEAKNEDVKIDSKYGSYTISINNKSEKVLTYKREFLLKAGNYPKEEYASYRNFWKQVAGNDNAKIVLIKK